MVNEDKLEKKFIDGLRSGRHDLFIFYNLFSILFECDRDFLSRVVDSYKAEYEKNLPDDERGWWFTEFHKGFRQCDVYSDIAHRTPIITEEELAERSSILSKRTEMRKDPDFKEDSEEYVKLGNRLKALNLKNQTYDFVSVTGHLDSIMWQSIRRDDDGSLYLYMDEFLMENVIKPGKKVPDLRDKGE